MASTIQVVAAQMVAQSAETSNAAGALASAKQERLNEVKQGLYQREAAALKRQEDLQEELAAASDDAFLEDAAEWVSGALGLDALFGGNEEANLNLDVQSAGIAAQKAEAEIALIRSELQRTVQAAGRQVQTADSSRRAASSAVADDAQLAVANYGAAPSGVAPAPGGTAIVQAEASAVAAAQGQAAVASSLEQSAGARVKALTEQQFEQREVAIEEQREGNSAASWCKLPLNLLFGLGAASAAVAGVALGGGVTSGLGATVAAGANGFIPTVEQAASIAWGTGLAMSSGVSTAAPFGVLGRYVADDSASATAAAGRAEIGSEAAKGRLDDAGEVLEQAHRTQQQAAGLADRIRRQRSNIRTNA